jgi:hypothetical protein
MPANAAMLVASASAILQLFAVASVGAIAALKSVIDPPALRGISRFSSQCLIPALLVRSVGSAVSLELLRTSYQLVLLSLASSGAAYISMRGWARCLLPSHQVHSSLLRVASVGFMTNNVSTPLVIVKALCALDLVNAEFHGDSVRLCLQTQWQLHVLSARSAPQFQSRHHTPAAHSQRFVPHLPQDKCSEIGSARILWVGY